MLVIRGITYSLNGDVPLIRPRQEEPDKTPSAENVIIPFVRQQWEDGAKEVTFNFKNPALLAVRKS